MIQEIQIGEVDECATVGSTETVLLTSVDRKQLMREFVEATIAEIGENATRF